MSSSRGHSPVRPARGAARAVAPAPGAHAGQQASPRGASFDPRLLTLQRQAGNAAVASLLAATHAVTHPGIGNVVQRAPTSAAPAPAESPAANPTMAGQLGALWENGVVVPLARAADRLGREEKDLPGARTDLAGALAMIRTVRDGTPADNPDRFRLTTVERIVASVLDVVDMRLGGAVGDSRFDRELLALRLEAVELQPLVTDKPPIDALVRAILGEAAADFEVPSGVAEKSASELWQVFVIDYLWEAQRDFSQLSPSTVWSNVLGVGLAIQQFRQVATGGDALQPRLFALEAGATALLSRLKERIPKDDMRRATDDDLADDSLRAYQLGAAMKDILTGKPAATPGPDEGTGEPDFTWERTDPLEARQPFENDTNLMQPGE